MYYARQLSKDSKQLGDALSVLQADVKSIKETMASKNDLQNTDWKITVESLQRQAMDERLKWATDMARNAEEKHTQQYAKETRIFAERQLAELRLIKGHLAVIAQAAQEQMKTK
eukprot:TRINITY_DN112673_c0_g1_i1.p1 TRINITY_DN112673_c0_g1~~TRINITY_DN112673_c0_g1_i1.p1  ORF type:complete len:114 (-),score=10.48 TRINITY_DN112673_c0_g1_i1:90-431(-)